MKIALASQSPVKIEACRHAFKHVANLEIIALSSPSGVSAQPVDDETLQGAFNRLSYIQKAVNDADFYISIENGIFHENQIYVDKAVAVVVKGSGDISSKPEIGYSDGVTFPNTYVEKTQQLGFDTYTVGQVMQDSGVIKQHNDPHIDLSGKPRAEYIQQALKRALQRL